MGDTPTKNSQGLMIKAAAGLVILLVIGVAGGSVAGFKVEPEECNECGKSLAACEARDELINEALDKAEKALIHAYDECGE